MIGIAEASDTNAVSQMDHRGIGLARGACDDPPPPCAFSGRPASDVRDRVGKADVIVVLGGMGQPRAEWGAGSGCKVPRHVCLISGDGDCYWIRRAMVDRGVDAECHRRRMSVGNDLGKRAVLSTTAETHERTHRHPRDELVSFAPRNRELWPRPPIYAGYRFR